MESDGNDPQLKVLREIASELRELRLLLTPKVTHETVCLSPEQYARECERLPHSQRPEAA